MEQRDRNGVPIPGDSSQDRLLETLYGSPWGRIPVKLMIRPWVSQAAGRLLDSRISALFIPGFRKRSGIDMTDYEERSFRSFNDFFTRRILEGRRDPDPDPEVLIAPCDSRLTVYPIGEDLQLRIKGVTYTLDSLLRDEALARHFRGGWVLVFRLTVSDYHRYCFPADGRQEQTVHIPGVFHTVNPAAAARYPIYRENTREYTLLESERFGSILQMEVGAAMVGHIVNTPGRRSVRRGEEKGRFEFGGSTVVLILEKDRLIPDADLLRNTQDDCETRVRMGESVGRRP